MNSAVRKFIIFLLALVFLSSKTAYTQEAFKLSIKQLPPLTITLSNDINATVGQVVNLDTLFHVSANIPYTREWKFWDGVQLQTVANPVFTVTKKGVFYLTVINENGCTAHDSIAFDVVTGIHSEQENQQSIRVYPNPNTGEFDILISDCQPGFSIQIINSLGVQLLNRVLDCNNSEYSGTIIMPNREAGTYFLLVKKDNKIIYRKKVIIAH